MLTYAELLALVGAAVRRQLAVADNAPDPQLLLNRRYHLRAMIRAADKDDSAAIDTDFDDGFDDLCERAALQVPGARTKADLRRGLRWWRTRFRELLSEKQRGAGRQPVGSLAAILSENLGESGFTHAHAASIVGVPPTTLSSWLQGVVPTVKSASGLARLETALKLTEGSLTSLARRPAPKPESVPVSQYRLRLSQQRNDRYRLQRAEAGPRLRQEWHSLLRYKTAKVPALKRSKRAVWSLSPPGESRPHADWHNTLGRQYCPTADAEFCHVSGFLGFLRSKASEVGLEPVLATDQEPTLALFAVPELVEAFFAWLIERADGVVNNRIKTLANFVQSLTVHPTGWLLQQADLADRLPDSVRPTDWQAACATVNEIATAYRAEVNGQSRDPFEPIRGLLALPEPFAPVRDAIRQLDARALSAGLQSPTAATAKRDAAILTVLLSVPLRSRNLTLLRYRPDGGGSLRKEPDGLWWLRIPAHETKNRKSIDAPLPQSAVARLDEYLDIHRPRLLKKGRSDFVFLASGSNGAAWWGINCRVFTLTKTYIPGCMGFHVHSWRHLVATRWLDRHPEDYVTVTHLLRDDLQTVMKTYSKPSPAKAIGRANKDLDALMSS